MTKLAALAVAATAVAAVAVMEADGGDDTISRCNDGLSQTAPLSQWRVPAEKPARPASQVWTAAIILDRASRVRLVPDDC